MDGGLRTVAVRGMVWTGAERVVTQALRFLLSVAMARLVAPADYGVFVMLAVFLSVASAVQDGGLASALIQRRTTDDVDYSTVFWYGVAASAILCAAFAVAAPAIARFYGVPEVASVARVASLGLLAGALGAVHNTRLVVAMRFRALAAISVASLVVSGVVGLVLAWRGWGAWALAWQSVAGSAAGTALAWVAERWRPRTAFSTRAFRDLFGFGWKLLASGFVSSVYTNIHGLVVGKAFGAAAAGHYNRAYSFAGNPAEALSAVVLKVNYPLLSGMQDDAARLAAAYRRLVSAAASLVLPALLVLAVAAEPAVEALVGEKWLPCASLLRILCLGLVWYPLAQVNQNALCVKGRSDLVLKLELSKKGAAFVVLFAAVPFGVIGVCAGRAVCDLVEYAVNAVFAGRLVGYGLRAQLRDLAPAVARGLVACAAAWFAMRFFAAPWAKLAVAGAATAAAVAVHTSVCSVSAKGCKEP